MKFFFKVFILTTLVIAIVCSIGSYALISTSFNSDVNREIERGLEEYQLTQFAFESSLLSAEMQYSNVTDEMMGSIIKQTAAMTSGQSLAVFNSAGTKLVSVPETLSVSLSVTSIGDDDQQYQISDASGAYTLEIVGSFVYNDQRLYLALSRSVKEIFSKKEELTRFYIYLNLAMIAVGALLISALSFILTRPIRKLKKSAGRIAEGRYHERVDVKTKDEIGELATSFNHMAAAVEQNIADLKKYAQQQEDFVANFSHELKTPLTSIIGYADLLRSEDLEPKDVFKASSFIFSEGKRLEAMSLKLMDMIVLERQNFTLRPINIKPLLRHVIKVVAPLLITADIKIELTAEKRIVFCEPDLLVTLIINLIDNGRKASDGGEILLSGKTVGQKYQISVRDFGRGIPPEETQRITEAFYMVDKSRSRAQHGAGLGLSIAQRVAEIHGSKLKVKSVLNEGTTVSFLLPLTKNSRQELEKKGEEE
ncbi:MAG: HAMP domain-containing sensor histidine kinase [Eubacteriales bacterium]